MSYQELVFLKGFNMQKNKLLSDMKQYFQTKSLYVYENSFAERPGFQAIAVRISGEDYLIATGERAREFEGKKEAFFYRCPMNHQNRLKLNVILPETKPVSFGSESTTFGFGDRLGKANYGQLKALAGYCDIKPVLAQQSMRELSLTGRTYSDVIDSAAWSVFKAGWKNGYAADGDHLKKKEEVQIAITAGCTMITLDCSEVLRNYTDQAEISDIYGKISKQDRFEYEKCYLEKSYSSKVSFDRNRLMQTVVNYAGAVEMVRSIYFSLLQDSEIDLEISLDETDIVTTAEAHFFIAMEMKKAGVRITSIAPKFKGQFQKAIDYIGDPEIFRRHLKEHVNIANMFGHKISVHSGSDKFRIFKILAKETNGFFHLKTSGTSWLEAVRLIARKNPQLFRDMYDNARKSLTESKKYYVVDCTSNMIPNLDTVEDLALESTLDEKNIRQLMHITYGFQLENQHIKERLYHTLQQFSEEYDELIKTHFIHHLELLKKESV